jgi:hypothetical protein
MKTRLHKFLLLVSALLFTKLAGASDRWETLRAINWVENPHNHTQVGRFGELGPYQFRPTTWRMHTDKPFRLAVQRDVADEVAVKHYEWIKRTFERAGVEANAFNIAMAWNAGADAVISGRVPAVTYQYAQRVTNLVETLKERSREAVASRDAESVPAERPEVPAGGDSLKFRVLRDTPRFILADAQ